MVNPVLPDELLPVLILSGIYLYCLHTLRDVVEIVEAPPTPGVYHVQLMDFGTLEIVPDGRDFVLIILG